MDLLEGDARRLRLEANIENLASVIGHTDRPHHRASAYERFRQCVPPIVIAGLVPAMTMGGTHRRNRSYAIALRWGAVGVADDTGQIFDVGFEPKPAGVAFQEIHDRIRRGGRHSIAFEAAPIPGKIVFATQ